MKASQGSDGVPFTWQIIKRPFLFLQKDSISPSNWLAAFQFRLYAQQWRRYGACRIDFYQTLEKMLAKLGFELTTTRLTTSVVTRTWIQQKGFQNGQKGNITIYEQLTFTHNDLNW